MTKLFILALSLLLRIPGSLCSVTSSGEYVVLEGESLTIPCRYEPRYASHVKYWCRGRMREFCSSMAQSGHASSTSPAEDKVSIFDDQVQQVFTVTMRNLQEGDSGWYMCGVQIGGVWSADVVSYTHINVIHGLSVVSSHVGGEEGNSITVECRYSERYRESEKKWCRSGDRSSCRLTGSEGSYEDASLSISDDRTRAFTVTLKRLQPRDSGWYWCAVDQQQIAVHVLVTPRSTTASMTTSLPPRPSESAAHLPPPESITRPSWSSHSHILESLLVCTSLMLLVCIIIWTRKLWRQHSPRYPYLEQDPALMQMKEKAMINKYSDLLNADVVIPNRDTRDADTY